MSGANLVKCIGKRVERPRRQSPCAIDERQQVRRVEILLGPKNLKLKLLTANRCFAEPIAEIPLFVDCDHFPTQLS